MQVEGLLRLESTSDDAEGIETARKALRAAYDAYHKEHGALVGKNNREAVVNLENELGRPAAALLALETKDGKAANLLKERQLRPASKVIESPEDAMLASQGQLGRLDVNHMATLLPGQTPEGVRNALIAQGSIYHSPKSQNWVTKPEYLSGDVRQKLEEARSAATFDPFYERNVAALEAIQPEPLAPEQMRVRVGSHWVPASVVNDFINYAFQIRPNDQQDWVNYSKDQAMWLMDRNEPYDASGRFRAEVSIGGARSVGYSASDILRNTLQGKSFKLSTKKDEDQDVIAKKADADELAREKADLLQEEFQNWVWSDPARREKLAAQYNRSFNVHVPREFDERGRLTFSGMSDEWRSKMREHQRDAVFRTVHDGSVLLAHEVGFGKTAVMIAAAMERKRLGLTKKAMIVVPKPIIGQFVEGFRDMYPGANVLSPTHDDFSGANREKFLARAATHDWDAVVVTREQFKEIPLRPETEIKWYKDQIRQTRGALEGVTGHQGEKKGNAQNALENRLKHWEKRLGDTMVRLEKLKNTGVTFEEMGVDKLIVDEAHAYKNLPYVSMMERVKGMPDASSDIAWDMFMKANVLQDRGGERPAGTFARNGVTFATGTPVSNTIAETWTMMRFLQQKELEKRGYGKFDAWAGDFAATRDALEPRPGGGYRTTTRFAKIQNVPALKNLFQNVTDIRVARETPELQKARPRIVTDDGREGRAMVQAPMHPDLEKFMEDISRRQDAISAKKVHPWEDNMLWLSNDAAEAAIDVRMQWPDAGYNPMGKVQKAADNVARIYKETDKDKGTQLVFLDRGAPPTGERKKKAKQGYVVNQYEVMRKELEERGIPRDKVAFIHESTTDEKRNALLEKVNDGDIRVLVASTEKGGTGVNVQKRAAALHHIDVAWRPSDIEQREGRIVRQGNEVYGPKLDRATGEVLDEGKGIRIFTYVQEGSFDEFKWGTIEAKAKPIHTIMQRYIDPTVIEMEDVDDTPATAAMARALSSRDPVALQAAEVEEEAKKLRRLKRATESQKQQARERVRTLSELVERNQGAVPRMEQDARMVESQPKPDADNFALPVRDRYGHTKATEARGDASRELASVLRDAPYPSAGDRFRGRFATTDYRGFTVEPVTDGQGYFFTVVSPSGQDYQTEFVEHGEIAGKNWLQRIDNVIDSIPTKLEERKEYMANQRRELETLQTVAAQGFERDAELSAAESELALAQRELALKTPEGQRELARLRETRESGAITDGILTEPVTDSAPAGPPTREPIRIEPRPVSPGEAVPIVAPLEETRTDESVTFVASADTPGETVAPDPVEGPSPETLPATEPDEGDLVTEHADVGDLTRTIDTTTQRKTAFTTPEGRERVAQAVESTERRIADIDATLEDMNPADGQGWAEQYHAVVQGIQASLDAEKLHKDDRKTLKDLIDKINAKHKAWREKAVADESMMATSANSQADLGEPTPDEPMYGAVDEPAKPARRVAKESKAARDLKVAEKAANKAEKDLDKAQKAFFENRGTGAALDKALDRLDKAGAKVEQAESQLADTAAPSSAETVTQPTTGRGHKPAKGKVAKRRKPPQRKQGKVSIGLPSRQAAKPPKLYLRVGVRRVRAPIWHGRTRTSSHRKTQGMPRGCVMVGRRTSKALTP